ncbi:MAG: hypothetical protein HWE22_17310 [Flavobacteriales bacterium]|nr:hypothetical protein [Flavobacteriales bacterium]
MSSSDFFWGLGNFIETILTPLDADWGITSLMNTGILLLGFVGLGVWLTKQKKFNDAAKADENQLK